MKPGNGGIRGLQDSVLGALHGLIIPLAPCKLCANRKTLKT